MKGEKKSKSAKQMGGSTPDKLHILGEVASYMRQQELRNQLLTAVTNNDTAEFEHLLGTEEYNADTAVLAHVILRGLPKMLKILLASDDRKSDVLTWFQDNNKLENLEIIIDKLRASAADGADLASEIETENQFFITYIWQISGTIDLQQNQLPIMEESEHSRLDEILEVDHLFKIKNLIGILQIMPELDHDNDVSDRNDVVIAWLDNITTPEARIENLAAILREDILFSRYDMDKLLKLINDINFADTYPQIENIVALGKNLYAHLEECQILLIKQSIQESLINIENPEDFQHLKQFITEIKDDDKAIDFVLELQHPSTLLSNDQVLEIAKARLSKHFSSVEKVLEGKTLEDALTPEGLDQVRETFPGRADITLSNLLSYYSFTASTLSFADLIKPEILAEIRSNYIPHHQNTYIPLSIQQKLFPITGQELPQVELLCDAILSKMEPVIPLTTEIIASYRINFDSNDQSSGEEEEKGSDSRSGEEEEKGNSSSSSFRSLEEKEIINNNFKVLLSDEHPNKDKVVEFFKNILRFDGDLNAEQEDRLCAFFSRKKSELATLFSKPGGIEKFYICYTTIADGCFANIANQLHIVLIREMFADKSDLFSPVLYSAFSANGLHRILYDNPSALHEAMENPLNSPTVREQYFSPLNFFDDIKREFYDTKQTKKKHSGLDTWEVIGRGTHIKQDYILNVLTNDGNNYENLDQDAAKLAACIVLKQTIPGLFETYPFFQEKREWYDDIIKRAAEFMEKALMEKALMEEVLREKELEREDSESEEVYGIKKREKRKPGNQPDVSSISSVDDNQPDISSISSVDGNPHKRSRKR